MMDNIKRFLNFLFKNFFYGGLTKEEFHQVKNEVDDKNIHNIIIWSTILGLFWGISLILFNSNEYPNVWIVFTVSLGVCLFTLLLGLTLVKRFHIFIAPTMYIVALSALGTGIGLSMVQPDLRIATLVAAVIMVPVFFIDRTIVSVVIEIVAILVYAIFGKNVINPEVYSWGLQNLFLFSLAGLLIGHTINKARFERYIFANSAEKLAEMQKNFNIELQKEVEAKTKQIEVLNDQLLLGVATMVEGRDNSTGGHISRTSEAVRILIGVMKSGEYSWLTDEFCKTIIKVAAMHDIGKITIDDAILRKPGKFTPEEYEIMKTHAEEGAKIIHQILLNTDDKEFSAIAENVAHYHHERYDGSGYPRGLKGDEIPLEARVMAVADVYDALVSKRVYKEKFSFEEANKIIIEGMGTQFDPALKKSFMIARPLLEEYYKENQSIN